MNEISSNIEIKNWYLNKKFLFNFIEVLYLKNVDIGFIIYILMSKLYNLVLVVVLLGLVGCRSEYKVTQS